MHITYEVENKCYDPRSGEFVIPQVPIITKQRAFCNILYLGPTYFHIGLMVCISVRHCDCSTVLNRSLILLAGYVYVNY